eukprot:TRINITY_DN11676_c0_g2_i2.p1 TRINITY_DN11676_c0_g2~~TRINITY_DN11676_c0_g2_i2.p1  ORF type:complete len:347 (+),score=81.36 TRINITY_DN11676_c0_g2_i2:776-1816(+)
MHRISKEILQFTTLHIMVLLQNIVEYINVLKVLLEKDPDLTIKNTKGLTPIEESKSTAVVKTFWKYLTGIPDSTTKEKAKSKSTKSFTKLPVHCNKKRSKSMDKKDSVKLDRAKKAQKESKIPASLKTSPSITLDSFIPINYLGGGSFGKVYLVKTKSTGKYYAMKILSKKKTMSENLWRYIYAERNVQSLVRHPFIVRMRCAFQTKGSLAMVMDYYPGGDLARVLYRERKFCESTARAYVAEIVLAIEELHRKEIIYRDLKPENVVIDSEGHIGLTDFGLSKEGIKYRDFTKSFCGSVAYLAPEILEENGNGHCRSVDWYLVGVMLYAMLVGIPPYYDKTRYSLS